LKNVRPIFTAETPRTQRQRREGVSNRLSASIREAGRLLFESGFDN
jgi:hypothetical protein